MSVSRDGVFYTVEYSYCPDGRVRVSHYGGVQEFDTAASDFILRYYKK